MDGVGLRVENVGCRIKIEELMFLFGYCLFDLGGCYGIGIKSYFTNLSFFGTHNFFISFRSSTLFDLLNCNCAVLMGFPQIWVGVVLVVLPTT